MKQRGKTTAKGFTSGQSETTTFPTLTSDEPNYLKVFAQHKHIHDFYMKCGELVNFHHHIQKELLDAYREAHDPYYHYNSNCPVCVAEFLTLIYRWYEQHTPHRNNLP